MNNEINTLEEHPEYKEAVPDNHPAAMTTIQRMAAAGLCNRQHGLLLYMAGDFPYEEFNSLSKELRHLYGDYQEHLNALQETITNYELIAELIRNKAKKTK